ncbi:MAG: homocysteine S-methyltransferase family protein [Rhodospirillaceae bacterium]|nr:homocysteine S-methyltransferase family protein [Rhodospirillaceae bacterium]MYB14414.1 homocysteine S-methyltransferase family protein [Rhodospirillaceae bacterium]MYI49641.1 homocysteine S-methyltransferase family protein [Rhodospirillaceae bacterium]
MTNPDIPALRGTVALLDGGIGQELYQRRRQPSAPLWSVGVMIDDPDLVETVHLEFIEAGARVLTLNSYSATPHRLARAGREDMFGALQAAAIRAAHAARERSGRDDIRVAGCLPPLTASFRPDLTPSEEVCLADYRRIVAAQAEGVDLFLCETLATVREARLATLAARESGRTVWTALTVDDADGTVLRSGEPVGEGARAALDAGAAAVLANCSSPEAIAQALPALAGTGAPFGAYANGFVSVAPLEPAGPVDVLDARDDLGPVAYAGHALGWAAAGATIVGGCCEIGPAHIAELARRLGREGYGIAAEPAYGARTGEIPAGGG